MKKTYTKHNIMFILALYTRVRHMTYLVNAQLFTDILLKTYSYKHFNYTLFGILFVHNAHFLILSLKCVLMSPLMRIVRSLKNIGNIGN